jgi:DNA polymerase-3 subunit epsilon
MATKAREAMLEKLSLRLRIFLFFAALALGGVGAVIAGLWFGYRKIGDAALLNGFVLAGSIASFVILGLVTWVWYLFDENVGRAIGRLSAWLRAQAHAEGAGTLDLTPGRYLGDLAPAAGAVAENLTVTRGALAEAVARETRRLAEEKVRLEALLSDVPVGVLLCSARHQMVFYNGQAARLLGTDAAFGLNRPVFTYLREAPLRHAHDRLIALGDPDAVSDLMVATLDGGRLLSGRMRLVEEAGAGGGGYVLTLRDVTADMAAHAGRERLLEEIFDRIRRPAASLQTVIGVMSESGEEKHPALGAALIEEVGTLARAINELGGRYDAQRAGWWPLPMTRCADLLDGIRARMEAADIPVAAKGEALLLRCNGFEVVALLAGFAQKLSKAAGAADFEVSVTEDGAGAMIELSWKGTALPIATLDAWLAEPVDRATEDVTGRSVLGSHATECWPEARGAGRAAISLPLREARVVGRRPEPLARRVVYDFDLLFKPAAVALSDTRLDDLAYVVFDTETTGLLPKEGDEIVQIAALRLVNGRRVAGEVFDTLVDPGRAIPARSTEVHGISDAMVAGAPDVPTALRRFHGFAEGAVLIAHNAPFDMEFLRRREAEIGRAFDNPILDTVLLSAVIYGKTESHSLDSLSHRLGITIPEEDRHTALGDSIATAEAFLKLLPMLKARGLLTFGDVLGEVRKHGRLLRDLNA